MPNPRLAGRYAKSLIDLAIEKNQVDEVYNDMLFLQSVCMNKDFVNLLKSPVIQTGKKENILDALTKGKISVITASFNKLVLKKSREVFLPEIVTAFIQQYKKYKGIYIVKLITAAPASEELKNSILNKIRSETAMQNIELNTEVRKILSEFYFRSW